MNEQIRRWAEALDYLAAKARFAFAKPKGVLVSVLFHSLFENRQEAFCGSLDPQQAITVAEFESLIIALKQQGFCCVSTKDMSTQALSPHENYALITFDDGYANNLRALPILERHEVPAVFFVSCGHVVSGRSFWWDVVYRELMRQGQSLREIRRAQEVIKLRHYVTIEQELLREFGKRAFVPSGDVDRPLTPEELANFSKSNFVEIGNHTYDHAILTLCSPQEVMDQISRCQETLCQLTGYPPRSIAYPNGACSEMVFRVARDLGLSAGFTTRPGSNSVDLLISDSIHLRRSIVIGHRPPMDQLRISIYGTPLTSAGNTAKRWFRVQQNAAIKWET